MKILHVNRSDVTGGAARAAYRLHQGLCRSGYDSTLYVLHRRLTSEDVVPFHPSGGPLRRAGRYLRKRSMTRRMAAYDGARKPDAEQFSDAKSLYGSDPLRKLPVADVINLHYIRSFIDVRPFFRRVKVPIVWTLHDMNPFTGGCHYDESCGRFDTGCGACPQLRSYRLDDLSAKIFARKMVAYGGVDAELLHIVAPSRWLAGEAARSRLFSRFAVSVIPNGLDTDVFTPLDRAASRELLGIPQDAEVVLFVADSTGNRRKGFALLLDALRDGGRSSLRSVPASATGKRLLVCVGSGDPNLPSGFAVRNLGPVSDDAMLARIYSAADVFVIPSLQDNLPNTVLEAMACGTPVVGFRTGGISDMVRPRETGMLAKPGDARSLRDAIEHTFTDESARRYMARRCREIAVTEYALNIQAGRYADLYRSMPGRPRGPAKARRPETHGIMP